MEGTIFATFLIIGVVLWAAVGGAITEHKGRGWGLGIALGAGLGLIGVIICLCFRRDEAELARRQLEVDGNMLASQTAQAQRYAQWAGYQTPHAPNEGTWEWTGNQWRWLPAPPSIANSPNQGEQFDWAMDCAGCGARVARGNAFCANCGRPIEWGPRSEHSPTGPASRA